jgi:hypothetical protein
MTDRKYESIKRAEKERLRAKKRLQKLVQQVRRERKSTSIVQSMIDAGRSLLDETSAWTDRLTADAARAEARMDVSLEASDATRSSPTSSKGDVEAYEADEAEARADQLVRQIRAATQPRRLRDDAGSSRRTRGTDAAPNPSMASKTATDDAAASGDRSGQESNQEPDQDALPDKTIGRMRR